jgi:DNA-binding MarR family transcriptional regulator
MLESKIGRVRAHLDAGVEALLDRVGLTGPDFRVVVALRRAGRPYAMHQARLMADLALTSGTVSVRVDRLVRRGVAVRDPAAGDRRSQMVRLTADGLRLFDEIAPQHLANEDRLLSALTADERCQLGGLLRRLLVSFETGSVDAGLWLGMRLEPAHVARARRTAVGLSAPPACSSPTSFPVPRPPTRGWCGATCSPPSRGRSCAATPPSPTPWSPPGAVGGCGCRCSGATSPPRWASSSPPQPPHAADPGSGTPAHRLPAAEARSGPLRRRLQPAPSAAVRLLRLGGTGIGELGGAVRRLRVPGNGGRGDHAEDRHRDRGAGGDNGPPHAQAGQGAVPLGR